MITSTKETDMLNKLAMKINKLQDYLCSNELDQKNTNVNYWYSYITQIKKTLGNLDNDVSFIACLMAKEFLCQRYIFDNFDVAAKPQSAPGLDIDENTSEGKRIIAEIKTTIPYGETDLGAQQKVTFDKDFEKLQINEAAYKYFFVTEIETFEIVKHRYLSKLEGVNVVLLPHALSEPEVYCLDHLHREGTIEQRGQQNLKLGSHREALGTKNIGLSDKIRTFIFKEKILPARARGETKLILRAGDIAKDLNLTSRYPAICSSMAGRKFEEEFGVQIMKKEGSDGANFFVTYVL